MAWSSRVEWREIGKGRIRTYVLIVNSAEPA
jgi:hypothetical protein